MNSNTKKPKLLRRMSVLLLTLMLSVTGAMAQNVKLDFRDAQLKSILDEISEVSEYDFVYSEKVIPPTRTFSIKYEGKVEPLSGILDILFKGTDIAYEIKGRQVAISVKSIQQKLKKETVRGVVRDASTGETLPAVVVQNLTTGENSVSDIDGNYVISATPGDKLKFSSVGMMDLELAYSSQVDFRNVVMKLDITTLDEVVVTGYQTISKERATGSFDLLDTKQLQRPTTNIAANIVGRTTGVQATFNADGDPTFEIRGQTSLYANAQPLIVVDGFAIEGSFSSINPNDVESITILKDAAAASIWGARSANGVIVVTTKSGKGIGDGKVRVEVNSFVKYSPKANLDYVLFGAESEDIITLDKMSFKPYNKNQKWGFGPMSDNEIALSTSLTSARVAMSENYLGYLSDADLDALLAQYSTQNNRQQIKDLLFANPFTQQHNVTISSSSKKVSNHLSLMYEQRQKYLKYNDDEKIIVNYRNNTKIFKWLDFNFSGMFSYSQARNNSVTLSTISSIPTYEMLADENGNLLPMQKSLYMPNMERYVPMDKFPYADWTYNPVSESQAYDFRTTILNARFQGGFTFNIMEGLKYDTKFQYEIYQTENKNITGEDTFAARYLINTYTHWDKDAGTFDPNIPKGDFLDRSKSQVNSYNFRNQVTFNRSFGKHSVNAVAGTEISNRIYQYFGYPRVWGYDDDKLTVGTLPNGYGSNSNPDLYIYNWVGSKTTIYQNVNSSFSYNVDKYFSMFFNAAYTYNDKYTVSGSARTDASNLITDDPAYRYSPFWSVGASWQIAKENFMKSQEWIDRLNLRVTYGYNGNVDRSTSFLPMINMGQTNSSITDEPTASISSYGNPTLRWEKTGTLDIGVDYSFLGSKLHGKVDFYNKYSTDLIASVSIPSANGTSSQKMNVADMVNRGVEFEIGSNLRISDNVDFYGNFNMSYNNNRITNMYVASYAHSDLLIWGSSQTKYVEGMNASTIWGCNYAGLHNDGTAENPNMQPKIMDKDGNLIGLGYWPTQDVMTYAFPQGVDVAPLIAGLSFGFRIHDFDISCIFTGKFGHVFRRTSYNYNGTVPNGMLSEVLEGNPDEILPLPQYDQETRYYFWDRFWKTFSYLTTNANHVRMQELNITYNMPEKILRNTFQQVQIYAQANNLFTVYSADNKYKEDPEYLFGTYKPTPAFTLGVRIGF